jgi:nucleotide-binding universal stress UspA family protein
MELPLVVGVDGSDSSLWAVDWAVDEAARHGLPLRLLYGSLWERYESGRPSFSTGRPAEEVFAEHVIASAAERARLRDPVTSPARGPGGPFRRDHLCGPLTDSSAVGPRPLRPSVSCRPPSR